MALKGLPQKENHGNYYSNLGYLILKTGGSKDSARHYLNKSLEDVPIEGKTSCLKSLYNLEKKTEITRKRIPIWKNMLLS